MNNKTLGLLALVGAPFFLLSSYLQPYFLFMPERQFYGAWGLVYLLAWMCSIRGLQRMQATGPTRFGTAILWILLGSLTLAVFSNLYQLIAPGASSLLFMALDAFWPLSNLLMLVVGITTVIAKQLKGWRRFMPLLVGLWLPTLVLSVMLLGKTPFTGTLIAVHSALAWSLLAIMVCTTKEKETLLYTSPHAYQFSS